MTIEFVVEGQPQGKQRPKFKRMRSYVTTYTPQKTKSYEEKVKKSYMEQVGDYKFSDVPIEVHITAYFEITKSFSKIKKEYAIQNIIKPIKKPDIDNICKVLLDGLNGVAYDDDKVVTDLIIRKRYSYEPRVEIRIKEVKA